MMSSAQVENHQIQFYRSVINFTQIWNSQSSFWTKRWYRKPSNTDVLMNYRSCAPLSFKRNIIQGTVHRIFNATSSWPAFDEALTTCKNVWKKNQYPEEFTDGIVLDTLEKCREIFQLCWKCTQGKGNKERPLYYSVKGAGY